MTDRKRLPNRRRGLRLVIGSGKEKLHISTGEYADGTLGEIFLDHQREGTFGRAMLNAFAMALSIGLQYGVPLSAFQKTFRDFRMEPDLLRQMFLELEKAYPKEPPQ
jgi:ribonucleoside-diphosphate reductase alpha chain